MLSVQFSVPAGSSAVEVSVQDARGGPAVSRRDAAGGGAGAQQTLIVPLPLVDAASLAGDLWPVDATVRDDAGKVCEQARITLQLGPAGAPPMLRVAISDTSRSASQAQIPWSAISPLGVEWEEVPAQDLLMGPALEFASCDVLVIPAELLGQFSEARLAALTAAGVRLAFPGNAAPQHLPAWLTLQKIGNAENAAWISPAALRHPAVLEPGLSDLIDWQKPATAQTHDRRITYWLGPAAVLVAVLVFELIRRPCLGAGIWIFALAGLSIGAIMYARSTAGESAHFAQWLGTPAHASDSAMEPAGPALLESLHALSPLYSRQAQIAAEDGQLLYPVAASVRDYWRLRPLTLQPGGGSDPSPKLRGLLAARSVLFYECRSVVPPAVISAASPGTFWVVEGQVSHGQVPPASAPAGATSFSAWIEAQAPPERTVPAAWYALRFDVAHRYLLAPGNGPDEPLRIMDAAAIPPAQVPPPSAPSP